MVSTAVFVAVLAERVETADRVVSVEVLVKAEATAAQTQCIQGCVALLPTPSTSLRRSTTARPPPWRFQFLHCKGQCRTDHTATRRVARVVASVAGLVL